MDDLVKRLRSGVTFTSRISLGGIWHDERCLAAADAIEALQARVTEFENSRAYKVGVTVGKAAARREAFEKAAKVADHIMRDYAELTYSPHHDKMQNAAKTYCAGEIAAAIRAALKGDDHG